MLLPPSARTHVCTHNFHLYGMVWFLFRFLLCVSSLLSILSRAWCLCLWPHTGQTLFLTYLYEVIIIIIIIIMIISVFSLLYFQLASCVRGAQCALTAMYVLTTNDWDAAITTREKVVSFHFTVISRLNASPPLSLSYTASLAHLFAHCLDSLTFFTLEQKKYDSFQ